MPAEDAQRWDRRYQEEPFARFLSSRPYLIEHTAELPVGGLILDVAMGLGGNAGYLIERGFRVVGVDISRVAVVQAHRRLPALRAVLADLTQIRFPSAVFDGVINFYYLQRDIWPEYHRMLKPGGLLILESLSQDMLDIKPDIEARFLLEPGELPEAFAGWKILDTREGWQPAQNGSYKATASIVARKPKELG